jgi:hypothetical protein
MVGREHTALSSWHLAKRKGRPGRGEAHVAGTDDTHAATETRAVHESDHRPIGAGRVLGTGRREGAKNAVGVATRQVNGE